MNGKFAAFAGLAAFFAACILSCGEMRNGDDNTAKPAAAQGPGKYMDDYKTSDLFFTRMTKLEPGTSPHGSTWIWYSSNLKDLAGQSSFTAPAGTVAIKEYNMSGNPGIDGIAVMIKKEKGFDPDHGDWFYEMRDASGKLLDKPAPGAIKSCIDCHENWKSTDYLAGTKKK